MPLPSLIYLQIPLLWYYIFIMKTPELYHGSVTSGIEILEPRQARNGAFPDRAEQPFVYASSDIDQAVFMAIIGNRKWGGWDSEKYGGKGFYIYEEFVDCLSSLKYIEPTGVVYTLNTDTFEFNSGSEWRSELPVKVLGSIAVGVQDLPEFTVNPERHPSHYR